MTFVYRFTELFNNTILPITDDVFNNFRGYQY